jgi:hypothetical protein
LALRAAGEAWDINQFGYTAFPIVGYDDKSGWLYGASGFIYNDSGPGVNAALYAVTNLDNFHSSTFTYEQRRGGWEYTFNGVAERAFDYYYGEGDLTSPNNPFVISIYHFAAQPALLLNVGHNIRIGLFDDYRGEIQTSVSRLVQSEPGDPSRLFPNESTDALGARAEWDTRDKIINSRQGDYALLSLTYGPPAWTTLPGDPEFTQLALDYRHFHPWYRNLVTATRVEGAVSQGDPSYLFRYRLGGLDTLQGYKDNRFRGSDYFNVQEELRLYILKWLSANLATDLGDAGDGQFRQLKWTSQVGLRLGLPPDWVQKLRFDLGYGFDQQTFQIQFGEIF